MPVNPPIKIAPSILSADFGLLGEQISEVTKAGADYIHVDVMDGHFVPSITIGAPVVAAIRSWTDCPFDVHLMVSDPDSQIRQFADAGADIITAQFEACSNIHHTIQLIRQTGAKAGVAINPGTPLEAIAGILNSLDLVLIMAVNPGYSGQSFIEDTVDKIACLRTELDNQGSTTELEVDGGINTRIAPMVVQAGARVLVAGTAVFNSGQSIAQAMTSLRASFD